MKDALVVYETEEEKNETGCCNSLELDVWIIKFVTGWYDGVDL